MFSSWRSLLLSLYYAGSFPYRRWESAHRAKAGKAPAIVLFYHRVADDCANEWTCSRKNFARQVAWLKRHFDMVSLSEAQKRVRSGFNARTCVTITFDDGYAENCDFALPLLVREKVPCTYFVSTSYVVENRPFPHDVALGRPLAPNTPAQLREMAVQGIELGGHTRTHPDLGQITDRGRLRDEVVGGRDELEQLIGQKVQHFAFPFGQHRNLNRDVFHLARDAGFAGVCSAYGGYNFPGDDPFHIQRQH